MSKKIFGILFVLTLALLYCWSRIQVIRLGYEVSKQKSKVELFHRENELIKSKIAEYVATPRLSVWAERFGMHPPRGEQILFISE